MFALVADAGIAFGLVLIMVLAVVVAVVGTICLVFKAVYSVLRLVLGGVRRAIAGPGEKDDWDDEVKHRPRRSSRYFTDTSPGLICENDACGHENPPEAVYCGRCGRRLGTR